MADPDDGEGAASELLPPQTSLAEEIALPKVVANLIVTIAMIVSTDHAMAAQIDRVIHQSTTSSGKHLDTDTLKAASRRHRVMAMEGEARIKALVHRHGHIIAPDGRPI